MASLAAGSCPTTAISMQMPHYHAEEATRALKPVLGDYYMFDGREVGIHDMPY